ncbi:Lrp/AsnC family transcriptional regulator [Geodermatophilus aquaeductus]|uniref:Lrp/AsnC family transcriptional regulator n=1 Tax=Geodermatophilus aquaeductus TaxID=1564161 RepID=UPI002482C420|nr:Lrp/AsnC family transcriptional regulator [Geodermatophilus aquaeductus]
MRPAQSTPGDDGRPHHEHDDHQRHHQQHDRHPAPPPRPRPCRPAYERGDTRGAVRDPGPPSPGRRPGRSAPIDAVDRQLIDLLRANGRASYAELARQVGLSAPAVHERVGKLEASGVVTGYRAVVDPAALGLDVTALVGVIESDAVDDTGVEAALRAMPEVEDCWRVAGSEGYVLKVRVTDIPALEAAINALNRIEGVARTRTTVVLSTKWEGRTG